MAALLEGGPEHLFRRLRPLHPHPDRCVCFPGLTFVSSQTPVRASRRKFDVGRWASTTGLKVPSLPGNLFTSS